MPGKYIPDEPETVWWQDGEVDVWEGPAPREYTEAGCLAARMRSKWIGRFSLQAVRQAVKDGKLKL